MSVTIPESMIPLFEQIGHRRIYMPLEAIFLQQDKADSIYIIKSGRVRVYAVYENGKEINFDVLRRGRLFGDASFLAHSQRTVNISAVTQAEIITCQTSAVLDAAHMHRDVMEILFAHMTDTNNALQHMIERLTNYDSTQKTADFLLEHTSPEEPQLPYTHNDIALCLGMHRVTVSRIMKQFADDHLLEYTYGRITVRERKGLQKIIHDAG